MRRSIQFLLLLSGVILLALAATMWLRVRLIKAENGSHPSAAPTEAQRYRTIAFPIYREAEQEDV